MNYRSQLYFIMALLSGYFMCETSETTLPISDQKEELAAPIPSPAQTISLKIMTWNLRYDNPQDIHPWSERRGPMIAQMLALNADVMGTQEGLHNQIQDICKGLPEYDVVTQGRMGGSRDEHGAIFYRKDRFSLERYDFFWLSDTPRVVGSNTWMGNCPRMVTWVELMDLKTNTKFTVWNTHFDNGSSRARDLSAQLLSEQVPNISRQETAFLIGDFNSTATPDNSVFKILTSRSLKNLAELAENTLDLDANTWNGFRDPARSGVRIDWIFGQRIKSVKSYRHVVAPSQGIWPSDHIPVITEVRILSP